MDYDEPSDKAPATSFINSSVIHQAPPQAGPTNSTVQDFVVQKVQEAINDQTDANKAWQAGQADKMEALQGALIESLAGQAEITKQLKDVQLQG